MNTTRFSEPQIVSGFSQFRPIVFVKLHQRPNGFDMGVYELTLVIMRFFLTAGNVCYRVLRVQHISEKIDCGCGS